VGPLFLDRLFRRRATIAPGLRPLTPSQYLERFPENQAVEPSTSSWGDKGYFEVWLNGANDWIYPLLHAAEERMCALARRFASPTPLEERALNQAARELMLAESSDWAFILTTDTVVEYARGRLQAHLDRFDALHAMLAEGRPDAQRLERIEEKDRIFDEMDWRLYRD
jgi:1,4-alpha-glucan branching enzyme